MGSKNSKLTQHNSFVKQDQALLDDETELDRLNRRFDALLEQNITLQNEKNQLRKDLLQLEVDLVQEPQMRRRKEFKECAADLKELGITDSHVFQKLSSVIWAIKSKTTLQDFPISEKIKDPNFRFYTNDYPALSLGISHVIADMAKSLKKAPPQFLESGRKQRSTNIDDFAREMHAIISDIRQDKTVKSYKDMAKALNDRNILTYSQKGSWRPSTLSDLNKRFEKLGLTVLTAKP